MQISSVAVKRGSRWLLVLSILLAVAGVAGFVFLFLRDFNVFWLILAPIVLALYQVPAVFVFWLWKRRRRGREGDAEGPGE
ncbi:MAG TPA: hypothetical protein VEG35_02660 [Burkholderiales bacterium]|nr:hypothetical protein [Burkholderiales bacterium]